MISRCDSAAMVPNTSDDLPDPETPVNTVSRRLGISTPTFLRLFCRAPWTRIRSWLSAGHLSRQFREAYGESPYSYLMTRRIERAMTLLRRGDLSVTQVCFEVGFSSLGTFSTRFSELVGMPPSAYRAEQAEGTPEMPSCHARQVTRPIRTREARGSAPRLP